MIWNKAMWHDIARGDARKRVQIITTLVSWFAMGAYILSVIDHHFPIASISDGSVALLGGVAATIAALCIKSV